MFKDKMESLNTFYHQKLFRRDLLAGLTLFVMLIPQGLAYAMLAGLPPVMGLYAATIPLFIYALFSSSKHLSIGPVAITSLLVFSGVSTLAEPGSGQYISLVLMLAVMVGAVQLLLGISKLGFIVKFIPHSVMNGYTSAAAIIIGLSQMNHLLGIQVGNHLQVHSILIEIFEKILDLNFVTLLIGIISILFLLILKQKAPKLPGALMIIALSILIVFFFQLDKSGVQIIGDIPQGFPQLVMPEFTLEAAKLLFPMAVTIALLGFMESLSIGKTIAKKEKYKLNPNKELKALGLSNMIGAFFQSFPVNGSFSRTAVNHQSGGATQMTSVITGALVMVTLLFFTSFFYYLPNAVLASIILVAVYKLIDFKEMKHLFQVKPFEGWIWVTTFLVTLFVGIQWGILIGAIFTLVLLLNRSSKPAIVELGYVKREKTFRNIKRYREAITSDEAVILRIDANLHFANISFVEEKVKEVLKTRKKVKWLIIDMSGVNDVDTVSVDTLEEMINFYRSKGIVTLFASMKGSIRDTVNKVHWDQKYKEQRNHLPLEQLLKDKGIRMEKQEEYLDWMI
ncbi:sulfate:proton symporter [Alkalihalobacillus alcalophilus ATCC 27647 = CGMCC 1.3604]|uniref:Sulfate transporter n=1 Tax=Alkalihalobacillus alcalophilus ATCC 27647 = CGMCC 1.3604 TaxID=1218173 RepID=A0A094WRF5_ALKAL|nr:sulfate permease [Alkalihalobacillus alcalophilus]KGA98638.1 sulfate transporter [Alkalihalobacillus alcalophilus ATCC 27647 = CGMCC 1.3604]MED1562758.1 sulfate permease [Alkalihalobacillus alcalophilus]THG89648.1 sulfate:proton symporter [Alkalihalobacillus alcalophilus ATCC 27647 = CGMCC 1.3604]